jgi:hypothetical protein
MKKTYVFTGLVLVTIALNSDRTIVLAATTKNPFDNPMKEDVYSDSTAKNPSSDSMTGEVKQLLGFSSSTSESNSIGGSSLNIALNPTETASGSSDTLNSTETASDSSDSFNSTEAASDSTDSFNSIEAASNLATTLDLSPSNTTDAFNLEETSYLTEAFNPTENFNSTQASNSNSSDLEPVPEPLTIFGTGLALGIGVLLNREHSKKQKATKHKSE